MPSVTMSVSHSRRSTKPIDEKIVAKRVVVGRRSFEECLEKEEEPNKSQSSSQTISARKSIFIGEESTKHSRLWLPDLSQVEISAKEDTCEILVVHHSLANSSRHFIRWSENSSVSLLFAGRTTILASWDEVRPTWKCHVEMKFQNSGRGRGWEC